GKVELKVEQKDNKGKTKLSKEDAEQFVSDFIKKSGLKDDMKSIEAIDKLLAALEISKDEIKELEFEVKFSNGKKLSAEFDEKDDDDDRKKRNNKKGR